MIIIIISWASIHFGGGLWCTPRKCRARQPPRLRGTTRRALLGATTGRLSQTTAIYIFFFTESHNALSKTGLTTQRLLHKHHLSFATRIFETKNKISLHYCFKEVSC